ncbi:MAG: hypothetical protein IIA87_05810 [Nanoarchaeota archaeon]|nr:hypothetical protein [Nanoarchaeota archaeon]
MKKRGISNTVSVVLLILIVIVIIFLLILFLMPTLRKTLFGSDACFNVIVDVNFDDSPYNCYAETVEKNRTAFSIKIDNEDVIGFRVGLVSKGSSNTVDVLNGVNSSILRMIDKNFNMPLEVNNRGGVRTYVARGLFERIDILPIIKLGVCETTLKSLAIDQCVSSNIRNQIVTDPGPSCGDGTCDPSENCSSCERDCACDPRETCNVVSNTCEPDPEPCGNSIVIFPEVCDPPGQRACTTSAGYSGTQTCSNDCLNLGECTSPDFCGDEIIQNPPETCDDGNTTPGDGCDELCQIESGWICTGVPSNCVQV